MDRQLTVTDSENLTVFIDVASISELGGLTLGRVSRSNTDTASAIVVNLQSSDTSEATVPASVVIPAGQAIANFLISAVDDTLLDGTQNSNHHGFAVGLYQRQQVAERNRSRNAQRDHEHKHDE